MIKTRTAPPFILAPAHNGAIKKCVTMTECAISTIELPEGHFAALVLSLPDQEIGAICILDREEVEAQIQFLRNAIEDADRLDRGEATIHAGESLRRS